MHIGQIINVSDAFLSFNYSKTLEINFNVSPQNILHVHGIANGLGHPYFGCPRGPVPWIAGGNNGVSSSVRRQLHTELIDSLTKEPWVEQLRMFFTNVTHFENIYTYGFSFGESDLDYIEEIISKCDSKTAWNSYCCPDEILSITDTRGTVRTREILEDLNFQKF